ncbi:ATP-dependent endonuclease [Mucilaginibacter sp. AW1-7]|uniref:ATP-dependent nuclease n=1 Tax=Mucilaginibacter sp. AW1-7 TaxID=3349874 RepID=UPI003F73ED3C
MFISKLFLKNFRSFKECTIEFSKGKNVIVGKNNCGKSNIVKALDMLLGEKFTTYLNITDNDFYTHEVAVEETGEVCDCIEDNFYIEATLTERDINLPLINSIIKNVAFSKLDSIDSVYIQDNGEIRINYDLLQNLDIIAENPAVVPYEDNKKINWLKGNSLVNFLLGCSVIKVFFTKSRILEDSAGYGLIVRHNNSYWISHYIPKKLRDSLITSTVINALRSPKEDLRVVNYTWFGKLVSKIWQENKDTKETGEDHTYIELILGHSEKIKVQVDKLFFENTEEIRKVISRAIAHQKVSFKLFNDNAHDLYKGVQIFVNDGIDRPITEKGTGIQSAVIIALFSLYCNKFHTTSSLLITEEPEVFLHPQARRIISAELNKYLSDKAQRQLIISTHSPEFLRGVDPENIIRVFKSADNNHSQVAQIKSRNLIEISQEIKRFLWSNNTEIFFADSVIMVEGGESYLLPTIIDRLKHTKQYLDYQNISIARVNGKGNFLAYIKMLETFKIRWIVVGDLDCYKDEVFKILTHFEKSDILDDLAKIKAAMAVSVPRFDKILERVKGIQSNGDAQTLHNLFGKFNKGTISADDVELQSILALMEQRYVKSDLRKDILDAIGEPNFDKFQQSLNDVNIHIWSHGDLETHYTKLAKAIKGSKDTVALQLSYILADETVDLQNYIKNLAEWQRICDRI